MDRLDRLRYAAGHYPTLLGLRLVPFGLLYLAMAAFQPGLAWLPGNAVHASWSLDIPLTGLVLAMIAVHPLNRYYEHAFGYHRPRQEASGRTFLLMIGFFAAVYGAMMAQDRYSIPLSIQGLLYAAMPCAFFLTAPRLRWYYGVFGIAFIAMSVLPALGVGVTDDYWGQYSRTHYTAVGLGLVVCGVLDHLLLRTLFASPGHAGGSREEAGLERTV